MNNQEKRAIAYWSCHQDADELCHKSLDAAVESYLDELDTATLTKMMGVTIHVWGFSRMCPDVRSYASEVLDSLLENIEEMYGSPEGNSCAKTDAMTAAAAEFCEKVIAEYTPWACEETTSVEVVVKHWILANCPGWLEDEGVKNEN